MESEGKDAKAMKVTVPNYNITRLIGSGTFGCVFQAIDNRNKKVVALKRIMKVSGKMSREFEVLRELRGCPHII